MLPNTKINSSSSVQPNTVTVRDMSHWRKTEVQEILPRIDVNNIVAWGPDEGALAYNRPTQSLFYANGNMWIPLGSGGLTFLSSVGTGADLVFNGIGPNLQIKSLKEGTDIGISDTGTEIEIEFTGVSGNDVTLAPTGVGVSLVADGVGPHLETKDLVGGTDIGLTFDADQVTINFTGTTGDDVVLNDAPGVIGQSIVVDGVGPFLSVKGILGGTDISTVTVGNDIVVNFTGTTGDDVTLTDAAGTTGQSVVVDGVGPALTVKAIKGGTDISTATVGSDIVVNFTGTTGDDVTLSDAVGVTGQSIVVDGIGPALTLKGIKAGSHATVSTVGSDIVVSALPNTYNFRYISLADSPYAVLSTDEAIGVHTNTGAITVNLPQISTLTAPSLQRYQITDADGKASPNKITINPTGGDTIGVPGGAPIIINSKYTTVALYTDGVNTWYLY